MPLPPTIRLRAVVDAIDPAKDIDGIHPLNAGLLRLGYDGFLPATAHAAVEILRRSGIEIEGRDAVVIGRSAVVGMPAAFLLVQEDATVTVCHSRTRDLAAHVARADIVVVAAGHPGLVTGAMLKPGAVVVDVGINVVDGHIVGDVDFASAVEVASAITPVPGGVGPLTNALLLTHLIRAAERQAPADPAATIAPPAVPLRRRPMSFPSDLEIARAVTPRPIVDVARDLGIADDELELYGPTKAKVTLEAIQRLESRAPARQVRGRDRDHPDPARRGQVDDHGRARPGAQRHRAEGRGQHPPAVARPGLRDQGRRGRRRLQPGHPDGGLQPPPDRRRPRDRRGPQPGRRVPRQQPPPQEPARHRPARDPLAAGRRHQRPGAPPRGHRPGRPRGRRPARDRVRHHRRLGGHGGPRPGHRPVRPAGPARPDRPRDDDRRHSRSRPRTSAWPAR